MKTEWLQHTILRAASLLAPGDQRAEWVKEWRSELWYIPRRQAMRFSLGAFRDALWLRRNNLSPATRPGIRLESPSVVLLSVHTAAVYPCGSARVPHLSRPILTFRNLPGSIRMLLISCLFLPGTMTVWRLPASRYPTWRSRLRGNLLR